MKLGSPAVLPNMPEGDLIAEGVDDDEGEGENMSVRRLFFVVETRPAPPDLGEGGANRKCGGLGWFLVARCFEVKPGARRERASIKSYVCSRRRQKGVLGSRKPLPFPSLGFLPSFFSPGSRYHAARRWTGVSLEARTN